MKLTLIVLTAATAFGAQESHLSVSDPAWKGIEVHFVTKVEPPGEFPRAHLPGAIFTENGRVHHIIEDAAHKRAFAYDLRAEPGADENTIQIHIEPMKLSKPGLYTVESGWTLLELPKYPVIPKVKVGDTVALDLLVNPATGQKIVDYLTVVRRADGEAHDFMLPDIEMTLNHPRVMVNGKLAESTAHFQSGISGQVVWFYLAGHGRFILSLLPDAKGWSQKHGVVSGNTLTFRAGPAEYRVECDGPIAPGSGPYNLYTIYEPDWRIGAMEPFMLGAAGKAEWVIGKQ